MISYTLYLILDISNLISDTGYLLLDISYLFLFLYLLSDTCFVLSFSKHVSIWKKLSPLALVVRLAKEGKIFEEGEAFGTNLKNCPFPWQYFHRQFCHPPSLLQSIIVYPIKPPLEAQEFLRIVHFDQHVLGGLVPALPRFWIPGNQKIYKQQQLFFNDTF